MAINTLDNIDRAILTMLQRDNTQPLKVISDQVNLSLAAVQRRIKRLNEDGYIAKNSALINVKKLPAWINITVLVEVEEEQTQALNELKTLFKFSEWVTHCWYVTGEADFVLNLGVPDMPTYEQFCQSHFIDQPLVKRFKTLIALDTIKSNGDLPLVKLC